MRGSVLTMAAPTTRTSNAMQTTRIFIRQMSKYMIGGTIDERELLVERG